MDTRGGYLWCFCEKLLLVFDSDILDCVSARMTLDGAHMVNEFLLRVKRPELK